MEVVLVKIRAKTHDKKMRIFRFLYSENFEFKDFLNLCYKRLDSLFPFGYFKNSVERFKIDFFDSEINPSEFFLIESCNHDYLSKYIFKEVENLDSAH